MSPVAVAAILAALWLTGVPRPRPDLRFSAPVVARPGAAIGLRAWQVVDDEGAVPDIRAPKVEVELRDRAGRTLGETTLKKSRVEGREGSLAVPAGIDDVLRLVARASIDGETVQVERDLYVQSGIESRAPVGRAVNPFQAYELGPIRRPRGGEASIIVDPRVEEGVCVPDLPCWLSVWVGGREGRVRIVPTAGLPPEPTVQVVRHGFARFPLTVVGSEALVEVELLAKDGALVAARRTRLPILPGGLVARAALEDGGARLQWHALGGPAPVLIDVFDGRRWVDAASLDPGDPVLALPGPGVWRIQARSNLFSNDTAAVCYVVVPTPHGPGPLRQAAEAVLAGADRAGLDPLALAVLDGDIPEAAAQDALGALFAIPSFDVVSTGAGASARIGDDEAFETAQDRKRWLAAAAILLIGLGVTAVLFRVERLGRAEADGLFDTFDEPPPTGKHPKPSGRGLWAFVLFVFVMLAVLALSKHWF